MPRRGKKRAKGNGNNAKSLDAADLSSPLQLLDLDTPTSTSSLTVSPSDLTPVPSSSVPTAVMNPHGMDPHDEMHLSEGPPADVHSKLGKPSLRYSATNTIGSFHGAFSSSKMLQQVLGIQPPEPYSCPPFRPEDLEKSFVAGMKWHGLNVEVPGEDPLETILRAAAATEQQETPTVQDYGKHTLDVIEEEQESPARSMHNKAGPAAMPADEKTDPPAWLSENRAAFKASCPFTKTDLEYYEQDWDLYSYPSEPGQEERLPYQQHTAFDSTTTLADSEPSRPGSSALEQRDRTARPNPDTTNATQIDSFAHVGYGTNHGAVPKPLARSSSLANLKYHMSHQAEGKLPNYYDDARIPCGNYISAQPPLFPSPRVDPAQSWDGGQAPREPVPTGFTHNTTAPDTQMHYADEPQEQLSVPQIQVEPPSPAVPKAKKKNKHSNRKRRASVSQDAPPAKARTDDSTMGLPILAVSQEALWKAEFPGNTPALLTIVLPWSLSMKRLFTSYPDPKIFSLNRAFPYKVTPPLHIKLLSAAFYDLSVPPHKEIRFLGPGHAVNMSYNEVDIFAYPEDSSTPISTEHSATKAAMKRALGLPVTTTDYAHMPMHQRAAMGQGRWAYILLQGASAAPGVTPPHAMIAWPTSAVTDSSDCMHFVYPDAYKAAPRAPLLAPKAPRRFGSLQNLAHRFVEPKRLRQELSAASSEELPSLATAGVGAVVLKKRVVKMEKAGRIPLIEGHMVDVKSWEGFLEAVGKGKGKVIMWMERE
jgi:hypothetical protein